MRFVARSSGRAGLLGGIADNPADDAARQPCSRTNDDLTALPTISAAPLVAKERIRIDARDDSNRLQSQALSS